MKKRIINICSLVCVSLIFFSCEDYLDKTPDATAFTDEEIFTSYSKSQQFVDQLLIPGYYDPNPWQSENYDAAILNGLPQGMWGTRDRWTDDCMYNTNVTWNWQKNLRTGNFNGCNSNTSNGWWSENHHRRFNNLWKGIRVSTMAITNAPRILDGTSENVSRILGLAYFMKGHHYFEILQGWGGMPWIEEPLDPESDMDLPRDTYRETAQKIAQSFDEAAKHLPMRQEPSEFPRPSKMSALAYKAKALIWAASPFANPENDRKLWEDAAIAAGQAIDAAEKSGYYGLVSMANWKKLHCDVNEEAFKEVLYGILVKNRQNGGSEDFQYTGIRSSTFGNGAGAESPTENLAECFPWSNGEPVDPTSDEYKYTPFKGDGVNHTGRDPRFDLTLIYNDQVHPITQRENRNVRMWNKSYDGAVSSELRVNAQGNPENGHSLTGYYIRKLQPDTYFSNSGRSNLMFNYIRLADVYLYYAEAANRAWGPTGTPTGISGFTMTAVDALNKVRARAGMPAYDNSKSWLTIGTADEFEKKIRNEIRIETAFEGKRFYDLRRWRIMTDPNVLVQRGLYIERTSANTFEYSVVTLANTYQLIWEDRHHLFPINPSNTFLGPNFNQNPGW